MYILHEIPNVKYIAARKHVNRRIQFCSIHFAENLLKKIKRWRVKKERKLKCKWNTIFRSYKIENPSNRSRTLSSVIIQFLFDLIWQSNARKKKTNMFHLYQAIYLNLDPNFFFTRIVIEIREKEDERHSKSHDELFVQESLKKKVPKTSTNRTHDYE